MPLSYKEIAEIIKIIDTSDCEELVVELDGARLEIRRHGTGGQARAAYSDQNTRAEGNAAAFESGTTANPTANPTAAKRPGTNEPGANGPSRAGESALAEGGIAVRSPMVGTFYRAPNPQEPHFVEVGDSVKPGDPLCLIEVMKLFTTIDAEVTGRIVEIVAQNAALVEHDQILFIIEPA